MLPTEIWHNIGMSLDMRSIARLGQSNKRLRLIFTSQQFWHRYTFYQAQTTNIFNTVSLHELEPKITCWFDFYRCASQQAMMSIHSYRGRKEERIPIMFPRYTTDRVVVDYFGKAHLIDQRFYDEVEAIPLETELTQVLWSGGTITRYVLYAHERKLIMYYHISLKQELNLVHKTELARDVDDVSCTPLRSLSSCVGAFDLPTLYILLRRGNKLSQIKLEPKDASFGDIEFQEEEISYKFDIPWWSRLLWRLTSNLHQSTVSRYFSESKCILEYYICVTDNENNLYSGVLRRNNEITFQRVGTGVYLKRGCVFHISTHDKHDPILLEKEEKTHTNILVNGYPSWEHGLLFIKRQGKTYNAYDLVMAHHSRTHMYLSSK